MVKWWWYLEFIGGVKYFVSSLYEKKLIENSILNGRDIKLAICLSDSNIHIGNVYATDIDFINRSCEIHILIGNKNYWNHGYGSEATTLLLEYLFNERGLTE